MFQSFQALIFAGRYLQSLEIYIYLTLYWACDKHLSQQALLFAVSSYEVLSYEGTIRYYINMTVPAQIQRILEQGKALLLEQPFPVDKLSNLTTLAFEDEEKARKFLRGIIQLLEFSEPYDLD